MQARFGSEGRSWSPADDSPFGRIALDRPQRSPGVHRAIKISLKTLRRTRECGRASWTNVSRAWHGIGINAWNGTSLAGLHGIGCPSQPNRRARRRIMTGDNPLDEMADGTGQAK